MRRAASALSSTCIRQHTSAYVNIRQHTSAYVSIHQHPPSYAALCSTCPAAQQHLRQHTSAYVSIRQHTSASAIILSAVLDLPREQHLPRRHPCSSPLATISATYVSIRQHTSAYVALAAPAQAHPCSHPLATISGATRLPARSRCVSIRQHMSAYVSIRSASSIYRGPRGCLQGVGARDGL
jgi:hypothetical protein